MKAGIYETPNRNLIYVGKDRVIRATSISPSSWVGLAVKTAKAGEIAIIPERNGEDMYHCVRVADVPNGCTDPAAALLDYQVANVHQAAYRDYPGSVGKTDAVAPVEGFDPYKATAEHFKTLDPQEERKPGMPAVLGMGYGEGFRDMIASVGKTDAVVPLKDWPVHETHGPSRWEGEAAGLSNLPRVVIVEAMDFRDLENRVLSTLDADRIVFASGHNDAIPNDGRRYAVIAPKPQARLVAREIGDLYGLGPGDEEGWRICHAQSARKHRKQGHQVVPMAEIPGAYFWRPHNVGGEIETDRASLR